MFIRVQEVAVEQWIACHMPRGPYLVNYLEKGGAREAREAENSVGCGVVYIVIGALENVLDESG